MRIQTSGCQDITVVCFLCNRSPTRVRRERTWERQWHVPTCIGHDEDAVETLFAVGFFSLSSSFRVLIGNDEV